MDVPATPPDVVRMSREVAEVKRDAATVAASGGASSWQPILNRVLGLFEQNPALFEQVLSNLGLVPKAQVPARLPAGEVLQPDAPRDHVRAYEIMLKMAPAETVKAKALGFIKAAEKFLGTATAERVKVAGLTILAELDDHDLARIDAAKQLVAQRQDGAE